MNGRYLFQIGDEVIHSEEPDLKGRIVQLLTFDDDSGLPVEEQDPSNPWYRIEWEETPNSIPPYLGFEHEETLLPGFVCTDTIKMVIRLYEVDHDLWVKLLKEVTGRN